MDNKHGLVEDAATHSGIRHYVVNPTNRQRSNSTDSRVQQPDADQTSSRPRSKGRFSVRKSSGSLDSSVNMSRQGRESTQSLNKWGPQASPSWFKLSNSQIMSPPYDATFIASANVTEVEEIVTPHSSSSDELSTSLNALTINDVPKSSSSTDLPRIPRLNPSLRPLNKQLHLNIQKEIDPQADKQSESNSIVSDRTSTYFNARQHGIRVKPKATTDRSFSLAAAPAEEDLLGSGVWKITDSLYIGTELFSINYHSICRLDIKLTIELQDANEETNPPYQRCFCEKNHSTSRLILKPIPNEQGIVRQRKKNEEIILRKLGSFCKAVNEAVSKGGKVLVFSKKAVNRGPAFCSAYLMLMKKITKQAAQFEVKKRMFPHTIKIEPNLEHTLRLWNAKLGYLDEPGSLSSSTKELSRSSSYSSAPDLREEGTASKTRRLKRSLSRTASRIFRSPSMIIKK